MIIFQTELTLIDYTGSRRKHLSEIWCLRKGALLKTTLESWKKLVWFVWSSWRMWSHKDSQHSIWTKQTTDAAGSDLLKHSATKPLLLHTSSYIMASWFAVALSDESLGIQPGWLLILLAHSHFLRILRMRGSRKEFHLRASWDEGLALVSLVESISWIPSKRGTCWVFSGWNPFICSQILEAVEDLLSEASSAKNQPPWPGSCMANFFMILGWTAGSSAALIANLLTLACILSQSVGLINLRKLGMVDCRAEGKSASSSSSRTNRTCASRTSWSSVSTSTSNVISCSSGQGFFSHELRSVLADIIETVSLSPLGCDWTWLSLLRFA